ncbi:hypothetical protein ColKHC_07832 [Colletotrichum higginsianum]|nr:hypothetical protein ColKHC_07832 [Colletotrichum higginsianum]
MTVVQKNMAAIQLERANIATHWDPFPTTWSVLVGKTALHPGHSIKAGHLFRRATGRTLD